MSDDEKREEEIRRLFVRAWQKIRNRDFDLREIHEELERLGVQMQVPQHLIHTDLPTTENLLRKIVKPQIDVWANYARSDDLDLKFFGPSKINFPDEGQPMAGPPGVLRAFVIRRKIVDDPETESP